MSEWQPIETAPKNGQRILLWGLQYVMPVTGSQYFEVNGWRIQPGMNALKNQPTHWMPLPRPPEKTTGEVNE